MGENSIILPIDRVISEDVDGTRVKLNKGVYRVIKYYERKQLHTINLNSRQLVIQLIKEFNNNKVKLAISIISLLLFSVFLLTILMKFGFTEEVIMIKDYKKVRISDEANENAREHVQLHESELETIKRSIVEGLGLKRIPDPSKANVSQTEYERAHVEYLRRLQMSRAPGDRRRRRLHTFHAIEEMEDSSTRTKREVTYNASGNVQIYFPLNISYDDEEIDHATLRLILDSMGVADHVELSIYRIGASGRDFVLNTRFKRMDGPRWIEWDVTELVSSWQEYPSENLSIELHILNSKNSTITISEPVLNVFSITYGQLRSKRGAPDQLMSLHKGRRTECRGDNKKCCRHEMTVIFKDLKGFEFIIQPKNFDAGYCKGRCPPRYNPAHHHALLQSLIWKEDRKKAPRPCCAPSKLAELEILYFDENDPTKLKVSSWKNMRVLECACS